MDIYTNLFDQEVVWERHVKSECMEAEKRGERKGKKEGEKAALEKLALHYMSENPELTQEKAMEMAKKILG